MCIYIYISIAEATCLELGALPEGLLLATAAQSRKGDSLEVTSS